MDQAVLSPAAQAFRRDAQRLCKVSASLGDEDERQLAQILEVLWSHLQDTAHALLSGAAGQAVMYGYQCDGTPLRATSTIRRSHGEISITRRGKVLHEFLLQQKMCSPLCLEYFVGSESYLFIEFDMQS